MTIYRNRSAARRWREFCTATARSSAPIFRFLWTLDPSVRVPREPLLFARVHVVFAIPRPAAELRPLIVAERLLDLRARVHHERTVLRDRLVDRSSLQQEQLRAVVAGDQLHAALGQQLDLRRGRDLRARRAQARASEIVERASDAG